MTISLEDRVVGALMGALIGDALTVGPHWYYDLEKLQATYGTWINDYTTPMPGHYHDGLKAGQSSQSGLLLELMMRSLAECGGYDEADFCRRLDQDFFPQIDGTPKNGPGGYTSQSMRDAYRLHVQQKKPWGAVGGNADNTEAAERILAIAVRYAKNLRLLAQYVSSNTVLTQIDTTVGVMTTCYGAVLGLLVQGEPLDSQISNKLMALVQAGALPFHTMTKPGAEAAHSDTREPSIAGQFPSPDALLLVGTIARAAHDPGVQIEPAWKASLVYGMPCAVYYQFPAAYYLAARFADNFEAAVLHAVNGGGQNQARAILTGALVGAMVGIQGIPERFLQGLDRCAERLALAQTIAAQSR